MEWTGIFLGVFIAGIIITVSGLIRIINRRYRKFPEGATEIISGGVITLIGLALFILYMVTQF